MKNLAVIATLVVLAACTTERKIIQESGSAPAPVPFLDALLETT